MFNHIFILGNILLPVDFFAAPVNIIILLSLVFIVYTFKNLSPISKIWIYISSGKAAFTATIILFTAVLIIAFFPPPLSTENFSSQTYSLPETGNFAKSWIFSLIFLYFLFIHLAYTYQRLTSWNFQTIIFAFINIGLIIILSSLFFGSADIHTYKMNLAVNEVQYTAIDQNNNFVFFPFGVKLTDFKTEHYVSGVPKKHTAVLEFESNEKHTVGTVSVNHPFHYNIFDIYILNYDKHHEKTQYCTIQLIKDPWKGLVKTGIVMMIIGCLFVFFTGFQNEHLKKANNELE
ncbi:MAG: cytochrome c biogenesis protein ResB [Bacteroidales bacterium]